MALTGIEPQALAKGYSVGVDLPLRFAFSGGVSGGGTAAGYKLTLDTPLNVGLGYESYSAKGQDVATGSDVRVKYAFTDLFVDAYYTSAHVALGYGFGKAQMDPFVASLVTYTTDAGSASQFYLAFGWPFNNGWEAHLGYHQVSAHATLYADGVATASQIDLGGTLTTVGLKNRF